MFACLEVSFAPAPELTVVALAMEAAVFVVAVDRASQSCESEMGANSYYVFLRGILGA